FELGGLSEMMLDRIAAILPRLFVDLYVEPFRMTRIEPQITATNDGEFFMPHNDNTHTKLRSRRISFVYFFHREPARFSGGALRIYDSSLDATAAGTFRDVIPMQNMIVFFPSGCSHEIRPVFCPSRTFSDSRFTLNGWIHAPL